MSKISVPLLNRIDILRLKVYRTIADFEGTESIKGSHISEAIQYLV
nr:hypothetical protein [Psychroserpens algicola]